jgi:hypothetical protein
MTKLEKEDQPDLQLPPTIPTVDMTQNVAIEKVVNTTILTLEYTQFYEHCRKRYGEVEELLELAVEIGKLDPPSLATQVKNLKKVLYYTPQATLTGEQLCETEAMLEILYTKIAQLVAPVTIDTLRATSDKYPIHRSGWIAWLLGSGSLGRNFLRQLFWAGILLLVLMFVGEYLYISDVITWKIKNFIIFLVPFFYGAIGSWIYLYKTLTNFYLDRCLNPKEVSTQWLRLFMGSLGGGITVHLLLHVNDSIGSIAVYGNPQNRFASMAAIGLLAGYSVDFFYNMLDRLLKTLLPPPENRDSTSTPLPTAKQMQMEALLKRLNEAENDHDKAIIRALLDKL